MTWSRLTNLLFAAVLLALLLAVVLYVVHPQ